MKKGILFLLISLLLLSGCANLSQAGETVFSGPGNLSTELAELKESFPEYFGLDAANGLDVIVWQMAPSAYYFGLLEHSETPRDWLDKALLDIKGVTAEQLREILATYAVSEDAIHIIPWENPISSYLPEYLIDGTDEDAAKKEAYVEQVRAMLFD